jgi:hypothetical protein
LSDFPLGLGTDLTSLSLAVEELTMGNLFIISVSKELFDTQFGKIVSMVFHTFLHCIWGLLQNILPRRKEETLFYKCPVFIFLSY